MTETKNYKFEIGKLADFLLSNGFRYPNKGEQTVDYAISVIRENVIDRDHNIFGKRFKHNNDRPITV